MAEFRISASASEGVSLLLKNTLESVCEDVAELAKYLNVTADEFQMIEARTEDFASGRIKPSSAREGAIVFMSLAQRVAEKCLSEIAGDEIEACTVGALLAQQMLTKAAGNCFGIQLGKRADLKLSRIRDGASIGGLKGAQTRRQSAIQPDAVIEAARKLGWPADTSGINKRLSIKFDCSPEHVGRILRKAKSDT